MMMTTDGFIINNTIDVRREDFDDDRISQIRLCVGSITKAKDPVDVLVISAFSGDYTPTKTSVIGALKYDLGINVQKLSLDKEKDYRKLFSCWWSKPLKVNVPFKRILCFEGGFKQHKKPPVTVGEVFRSLVPLCDGDGINVMMSLLSSGDQNYSSQLMLRLIVQAAIHWMKTGLPLKQLDIVIYQRQTDNLTEDTKKLCKHFNDLKEKWNDKENTMKLKEVENDFYISYSTKNIVVAEMVKRVIEQENKEFRIHFEHQNISDKKSWQDEIYLTMSASRYVLVLLTPEYLEDSSCIEQYNIALCYTRRKPGRDYLVPLYVKNIDEIPTYISLIQYIDCRPVTDQLLKEACQKFTTHVCKTSNLEEALKVKPISLSKKYDIFISYSHKDSQIAKEVYDLLMEKNGHWEIFIDIEGLKAGSNWQSKLYESIENSKTMLALVSGSYIQSKVCQEEFNLARSMYEDPNYNFNFIEVHLEQLEELPRWCTASNCITIFPESKKNAQYKQLISMLDREKVFGIKPKPSSVVLNINKTTKNFRKNFKEANFPIAPCTNFTSSEVVQSYQHQSEHKYDIILSFHANDHNTAFKLKAELNSLISNIKIHAREETILKPDLQILDEGKLIIPLLSSDYVKDNTLMEEYNTALCRHRFNHNIVLFPIIVNKLPKWPVYPLLSFCFFSTEDDIWRSREECLKTFALVISNIIARSPSFDNSFKTLLSMRELQDWRSLQRDAKVESSFLFSSNNSSHCMKIVETAKKRDDHKNDGSICDNSLLYSGSYDGHRVNSSCIQEEIDINYCEIESTNHMEKTDSQADPSKEREKSNLVPEKRFTSSSVDNQIIQSALEIPFKQTNEISEKTVLSENIDTNTNESIFEEKEKLDNRRNITSIGLNETNNSSNGNKEETHNTSSPSAGPREKSEENKKQPSRFQSSMCCVQ